MWFKRFIIGFIVLVLLYAVLSCNNQEYSNDCNIQVGEIFYIKTEVNKNDPFPEYNIDTFKVVNIKEKDIEFINFYEKNPERTNTISCQAFSKIAVMSFD